MQIESPRDQRFTSPITIHQSLTNFPQSTQNTLILPYTLQNNQNIQKQAVNGLISYGKKNNCQEEARQLANHLEKAVCQQNKKAIGDAIIHLYTKQSFLYKDIKRLLREAEMQSSNSSNTVSESYTKIYDLLPFCSLLNDQIKYRASLAKFRGTVYRSCHLNQQQINQYIDNLGQSIQWSGFTSTTKNRKKAEVFGNVLFLIKLGEGEQDQGSDCGLEVENYSAFPCQQEVLLFAGMQIMIEKVVKAINKYLITIICINTGR